LKLSPTPKDHAFVIAIGVSAAVIAAVLSLANFLALPNLELWSNGYNTFPTQNSCEESSNELAICNLIGYDETRAPFLGFIVAIIFAAISLYAIRSQRALYWASAWSRSFRKTRLRRQEQVEAENLRRIATEPIEKTVTTVAPKQIANEALSSLEGIANLSIPFGIIFIVIAFFNMGNSGLGNPLVIYGFGGLGAALLNVSFIARIAFLISKAVITGLSKKD
jgi:hypothetical protein